MSTKIIVYDSRIFKTENGFNLYQFENIDYKETMQNVGDSFKAEYETDLIKVLKKIGLKYIGLEYYNPRAYNFEGDSLDLKIRVINKYKFKEYVEKYKEEINKALIKNKSYDGYMSTTQPTVWNELDDINQPHYEPDIIVLSVIINKLIDFSVFNPDDFLVYEVVA